MTGNQNQTGGGGSEGGESRERRLVLVIKDMQCCYRIYSVPESHVTNGGLCDGGDLPEPDKVLTPTPFPMMMSFTPALGKDGSPKLYMAGGIKFRALSNQVFIYDVLSRKIEEGPHMCSGKHGPILITVHNPSRIYALSFRIPGPVYIGDPEFDNVPNFEVLDICGTGKWHSLPAPVFAKKQRSYFIQAHVVYSSKILISVKELGIYAFNMTKPKRGWKHLSTKEFPFYGIANRIGSDDSSSSSSILYCGRSRSYNAYHGYRILLFKKKEKQRQSLIEVTEVSFNERAPPSEYPLRSLYSKNSLIIPSSTSTNDDKVLVIHAGFTNPVSIEYKFDRSSTFCHLDLLPCKIYCPNNKTIKDEDEEHNGREQNSKLSRPHGVNLVTLKPCNQVTTEEAKEKKGDGRKRERDGSKRDGDGSKRERDGNLFMIHALGYKSYRVCPLPEVRDFIAAAFYA